MLCDALTRLIRSAALRERMGAAGRRRIENECRPERTAAAYVAVYRRLHTATVAAVPDGAAIGAVPRVR